jgi:hypothetical protein
MSRLSNLLLCLILLGGCASQVKDPSGVWINQAAIDAAVETGRLREALLTYGPNLEWQIDTARQTATFSNGFELEEGELKVAPEQRWQVSFYGETHELLSLRDNALIQEAGSTWPEQQFAKPQSAPTPELPIGSSFEHNLYQAFLGGSWKIRQGSGKGGLVLFHADGRIEGLPASERYALCLAGDCAAMSGEHDSLWLQLGPEGKPWIFSLEGAKLKIFAALNRAQPDEMPDLYPGELKWLLERQ